MAGGQRWPTTSRDAHDPKEQEAAHGPTLAEIWDERLRAIRHQPDYGAHAAVEAWWEAAKFEAVFQRFDDEGVAVLTFDDGSALVWSEGVLYTSLDRRGCDHEGTRWPRNLGGRYNPPEEPEDPYDLKNWEPNDPDA